MAFLPEKTILFIRKIKSGLTKGFVSLLTLGILCTGCLTSTTEIPITIELSTDAMNFQFSGGQQIFTITSNTISWAVSSDAPSWLTVSTSSGANNGSVTVTANPNTSPTAADGGYFDRWHGDNNKDYRGDNSRRASKHDRNAHIAEFYSRRRAAFIQHNIQYRLDGRQ